MTVLPDPYGVDLALGSDGDLQVTPSGGLATYDGPVNVAQALVLRLRTRRGELPLHLEYGSTLEDKLLGAKALDDTLATAEARVELDRAIAADRRLTAVRTAQAITLDTPGRQVRVRVDLELAAGEVLSIDDVVAPRTDEINVQASPEIADLAEQGDLDALESDRFDDELVELDEALAAQEHLIYTDNDPVDF